MSKVKVYELAKELNKSSKELVEFLRERNIEVKSHMSAIDDSDADKIRKKYSKIETKQEKNTKKEEKSTKKEEKKQTPVIIRREVIITEEEQKENKTKHIENREKQVGFVERNKNADYSFHFLSPFHATDGFLGLSKL